MSLDQQLPDLLTDAAARADAAPPTRAGVETAIGRRQARRRRQRTVGTVLAASCLIAGVVGGLALARDDGESGESLPIDQSGPLPRVPLVGVELDGFTLTEGRVAPFDDDDGSPVTSVTFRPSGSLAGPLINVSVESVLGNEVPIDPDGRAVDLDGDGNDDAESTSTPSGGVGVVWDVDGRTVGVGGFGLPEPDVVDYASTLFGGEVDPLAVPAPHDLPERSTWTIPSRVDTEQAFATYRNGGRELGITASNQPGWFDFVQSYTMSTYGDFEETEVGDTFLGPAQAIVSEPRTGYGFALIRTESGLTIEIATDGGPTSADELRELLADGRLVELDPDNVLTAEPTTTTAVVAATTAPPTSTPPSTTTSVVEPAGANVPTFDREHLDGAGTRISMTFGTDPIQLVEPPYDTAEEPPYCPNPNGRTFERYFIVDAVFTAGASDGVVYDEPDLGLWWCAEAETTFVAIGHAAAVTPASRTNGTGVVVDLPR